MNDFLTYQKRVNDMTTISIAQKRIVELEKEKLELLEKIEDLKAALEDAIKEKCSTT